MPFAMIGGAWLVGGPIACLASRMGIWQTGSMGPPTPFPAPPNEVKIPWYGRCTGSVKNGNRADDEDLRTAGLLGGTNVVMRRLCGIREST